MIKLPEVTLFGIDCVNPMRALDAMAHSCAHVQFAEIVLLTDLDRWHSLSPVLRHWGVNRQVRLVHHVETDLKVSCPRPDHYKLPIDYEMASLREPSAHVQTSHLLFHEWDSGVLNPRAWNPEWIKYDFIGAPWPPHHEPGWPPCDGETNAVGNGGFSLRSVKYCAATRLATELFKNHPEVGPGMISSDMWPCRTIRPWLDNQGIKFAPVTVALEFSCENLVYSGQFGYHGTWTAELNNWGGRLAGVRPNKKV